MYYSYEDREDYSDARPEDFLDDAAKYSGSETLCRHCQMAWVEKGCGVGFDIDGVEYVFCKMHCCEQYIEDNQMLVTL